jgi:PAN domain
MIRRRMLLVFALMLVAFIAYGSLLPVPRDAKSNVNFPGSDIRSTRAVTPVRCQEICLADRRCWAWTWVRPANNEQPGVCWVKTGAPTEVADRCCISGLRPPTGRAENNVDRPGSDYRNFVPASWNACESACWSDRNCKSWTYVRPNTIQGPNAQCYLKNAVARPVSNTACISGAKPQQ